MNKYSKALLLFFNGISLLRGMEDRSSSMNGVMAGNQTSIVIINHTSQINKNSQSSVEIEWNSPNTSPGTSSDLPEPTYRVSFKTEYKNTEEPIPANEEVHFPYSKETFCWYGCFVCCLPWHSEYSEIN